MKTKFLVSALLFVALLGGSIYFIQGPTLEGRFTTPTTIPTPSTDSTIFNKCSGSKFVAVAIDSSTPREDIVIAGDTDVPLTTIELTSVGEAFIVDTLSFKNRNVSTVGDADNNISRLTLTYTNDEGTTVSATGALVSGVVTFSGLSLYVPGDASSEAYLYADLNPIGSSGSSATAGELIELSPRTIGGEAIGEETGATYKLCATSRSMLSNSNPMHVYESKPTFSLNSTSPSDSRTVSTTDSLFVFNIAADSTEKITIQDLRIDFTSEADFNTTIAVAATATLKQSGTTIGSGLIVAENSSHAYITFSDDFEIPAGGSKTFTLIVDTATLMDEDAGVDDPLTVSIDYGSSSDGTVTAGGVTWYETNKSVSWLGNLSTSSLAGNTLNY